MSARQALRITGAAAYHLLKLTHESSDVLPPLKSVAGGALYITELVKKFRTSKREWQEFGTYVQDIMATIVDSLGIVHAHQTETIEKLEKLKTKLNEITETIESKQREGLWARGLHFLGHPDMIAELKQRVDSAVNHLQFDLVMKAEIKIDKALKNDIRSKLRYVEGASWNPNRVCLEQTREDIIREIHSWVDSATDSRTDNILLLTGVAGAGKSTIAHTIAQYYHSRKQLVTSFFFDRETNERNNPKRLIGTIAADLCQTNGQLSNRIMQVIEADEGVASAPIPRQFDELVLNPCSGFAAKHPLVIVLDALDEGYDDDLLTILARRASKLPHQICFVVTARSLPEMEDLRQQPHVREIELDIHSSQSIDDVALFVAHTLEKVANRHRLDDNWPDPELVTAFMLRAEGLFLWVATICDYLLTRPNPTKELQKFVSASHVSNVPAESRMDRLYITILQACTWDDETFMEEYQLLLGAAIASKTPLTLGALGNLYQRDPLISILVRRQLSPLLTGLGDGISLNQPVRLLHQSFRDLVTMRALGSNAPSDNHKFAIEEKAHSQTLALHCLSQMNRELNSSIPGIGYLAQDGSTTQGIPSAPEGGISEELWYSCRFWVEHLSDVELPWSPTVLEQLKEFLASRLSLWMELTALYGQYKGLSKLQNQVKGQPVEPNSLMSQVCNTSIGNSSRLLAEHLDYMGRLEEALVAARESMEVYRHLAEDSSLESRSALSGALHRLSIQLYKLGYWEDALTASEEALELWRQLADEQPTEFTNDLANALHSYSVDLDKLGRHEQALEAIQESVKLRRQLTSERQVTFNSDLARSVHALSVYLHSLGRQEEALEAIKEAVKLRRQLASERPSAFTSDLANSVHELSIRLYSFGRHEEALEAIEEAVKLRRQLASERPAAFTSHLASSVHELSVRLYSLGRHEEALKASEEAVKLRRQLASERPAAFTPDLAASLDGLAIDYKTSGFHQKALETIKESVELYRPFAEKYPAKYGTDYADSLQRLDEYSSQVKAPTGALDSPRPDATTSVEQ